MDFRPTPSEEGFRREVRAWLAANLPALPAARPDDPGARVARARAWQRRLHDGGWAGLSWPRAYGGRGATPREQLAFAEEYVAAGAPPMIDIGVGPGLTGPTLIHHGTDAQKRRFLPPILRGDEVWCQGFSEPAAGSDLAAVCTRAELRGDVYHESGQKLWTSYARHADWCIVLARTDASARKHGGLTFLLVDMRSPGITIRPLVEMTGIAWFNEVFFDDVRVPAGHMVGALHDGWRIAVTTLAHERFGSAPHARLRGELRDVVAMARARRAPDGRPIVADPRWRQALAQAHIEVELTHLAAWRQVDAAMRDGPGPEGSMLKLLWSEVDQRLKDVAIGIAGAAAALAGDGPRTVDAGRWQHEWLWSRAATIYAGTSEVQRNIVAQRVLGLPRA